MAITDTLVDVIADRWRRGGGRRCGTCKARVFFVRSREGKPQIVNAEPDPKRGSIYVYGDDLPELLADTYGKNEAQQLRDFGATLYLDHHATCPQAAEWRQQNSET